MIPALVVLACNRLGLGDAPGKMLLDLLENMVHRLRTSHGVSTMAYKANLLKKFFGTGQGSGGSPHFWTDISDVILSSIDCSLPGFTCNNPHQTLVSTSNENTFVDDSGLVVDDAGGNIVEKLQVHSQIHETDLHVTRGKIALQKCFWILFEWVWKDGKASIVAYDSADNTDQIMKLRNSKDKSEAIIKRIGPDEEYRTLGTHICATGFYKKQLKQMTQQVIIWCARVQQSRWTNLEIRVAFQQYLLPKIGYAVPVIDIESVAYQKLQTKITTSALHALLVNQHYPHVVGFAEPEYLDLHLPSLSLHQGIEKFKLYMGHVRKQDRTAKLMKILKDQVELLIGKGRDPLEYPEDCELVWIPPSWLVGLGKFLHFSGGRSRSEGKRVLQTQRGGDSFLTDKHRAVRDSSRSFSNVGSTCKQQL